MRPARLAAPTGVEQWGDRLAGDDGQCSVNPCQRCGRPSALPGVGEAARDGTVGLPVSVPVLLAGLGSQDDACAAMAAPDYQRRSLTCGAPLVSWFSAPAALAVVDALRLGVVLGELAFPVPLVVRLGLQVVAGFTEALGAACLRSVPSERLMWLRFTATTARPHPCSLGVTSAPSGGCTSVQPHAPRTTQRRGLRLQRAVWWAATRSQRWCGTDRGGSSRRHPRSGA